MGKRTKDLENNEELVSGDSKIKKVALYVLGIILGLIFLSPFYILIINSFKSKKEIFKDTLTMPIEWVFDNYVDAFEKLDLLEDL